MPERILYPQFREQFEPTPYPFGEKATLQNDDGDFFLEGTFLDAHIYPIGGKERMYLSSVVIDHELVTIHIGDAYSADLASGSFALTDPPDNLYLTDSYGRPAGILVSDRQRLAIFQTWGVGEHEFQITQTEFAATCCMPTPEIGVRGILLEDGSLMTGRVWIIGGDGVVVSHHTLNLAQGCDTNELAVIRVDIVGDALFRRRMCGDNDLFVTPNPVRRLRIRNGSTVFECPPNDTGNFTVQMNDSLASDTVLRIRVTPDGVIFETVGTPASGAING